ncbi:glycoside hydrolase [Purpureocillium lavendulum]|uniref:Glycoside hydrolase n=1 Tax=Purpureocillium lavendulum TaxID=1247861 RepID=A0AB34FHK0_9HYPO|nr:glycoside hydrolase [Purpureocillium lavendulum]
MFAKTLVLSGLAAIGSAHVLMVNPVPFDKGNLNNSPLVEDGSDFPCKFDQKYTANPAGASNVYAQGSTQQLTFRGSAVHGGGSCQVSVTTDNPPTKNSKWKVIHSIIGGCPARGQAQNYPTDPGLVNPDKYDFTIPKELAAGNYTLAWTWFNRIGNREMYMNCAPMAVTGSGGSDGFLNTLPDMFVANLGPRGARCETKEGPDLVFPNPGKNVAYENKLTPTNTAPPGGVSCQAAGGPAPTGAAPTAAPSPPATTAGPRPSHVNNPVQPPSSAPGGIYITVSNKPAPTSAAPVPSQPPAPSSAAPAPAPAPAPGNAGGHAPGTACTSEGAWNCVGGASFQRCASGTWSAVQPMAAGVKCQAGEASTLNMVSKRAMRRAVRFAA